tara:strand:+ start:551 stop:1252 length:702 start_codon:yes stop_codon:yes gene_type:complete
MITTNIIIQARTGSKRLPRKMLMNLGKYKLIEWVIFRAKKSKKAKEVILATSKEIIDDELVEVALRFNIKIFRGSEEDVLGRFNAASDLFKSTNIVRVCADNPFIDHFEIDRLIDFFDHNKCDLAFNHQDQLDFGYADGFGAEILSKELLNKLNIITKGNVECREHLTQHIWNNPLQYKILGFKPPRELNFPDLKFDIDTKSDLIKIRNLISNGIDLETNAYEIIKIANSVNY